MKKIIVLGLAASAAIPLFAAAQAETRNASEQRYCTQIENRSGSHMPYRRVCATADQWRARLGNDWRRILTNRNLDDDQARIDVISRERPLNAPPGT